MTLSLRTYQARAIDELWAWFAEHADGNPIVDASVGSGKSVMIAAVCQRAGAEFVGTRILVLQPQKELLQQNLQKLVSVWPDVDVGVYSASVGRKQLGRQVTYATIDSVYKRGLELGRVDMIMVDECFSGDTLVSTPSGDVRIDQVKAGDVVLNAFGVGKVLATKSSDSEDIYEVSISNGKKIRSTGSHKFFTADGFKEAKRLEFGEVLFREEDLRSLRRGILPVDKIIGQREEDCVQRKSVEKAKVLFDILLEEAQQPHAYAIRQGKDDGETEADTPQTGDQGREWEAAVTDGAWPFVSSRGRMGVEHSSEDRNASLVRVSDALQAGYQQRELDGLHRSGRTVASLSGGPGHKKADASGVVWVEGVSRIQVGRRERVYNLHVDGHPSYFAGGLLVHNCHLIPTKESGKWRRLLADIRKHSPHARVIGWTGTPFRGNGVWLTAGESPVFTHIASRVPMSELLGLGYLAPLVPAATAMRIEAADVRLSGDDYVVSELAKAVDKAELTEAACDEIVRLGTSRRAWLVFCVTVEHAVHVSQALQRRGISCGVVTGETPKETREILIASLRAGKLRALVNVAVLTTGFDAPVVDAIFLLRPTKSPVLYNQIAGRGMRVLGANIEESTRNGKPNCLWADFTDTTATMGPVDKLTGRMPAAKGAAIAPFKLCPKCGSQNPTGRLVCSCCGHQFPPPDRVVHGFEASSAAVLSGQSAGKFKEVKVDSVVYQRHQKPDAPDSVRVEYRNGLVTVAREWLAFSAQYQMPRRKAEQWWVERSKIDAIPGSTDAALEWLAYDKSILKTPTSLLLNTAGKFDDIVEYRFADDHEPAATAATESLA